MAQTGTQTFGRTPAAPLLHLPLPVRQAWGDAATDAFADWMEVAVLPHMVPRDEYREILSRMDVIETRMDGLDGRMDSLERAVARNRTEFHQQMDGMRAEFREELRENRRETRIAIGELRQEMKEGFQIVHTQMDTMTERMLVQTRWMIGSLTVIGALVSLLLTIGMFVK